MPGSQAAIGVGAVLRPDSGGRELEVPGRVARLEGGGGRDDAALEDATGRDDETGCGDESGFDDETGLERGIGAEAAAGFDPSLREVTALEAMG